MANTNGKKQRFATREDWLQAATVYLTKFFAKRAVDIPQNVRLSCGFPHGSRGNGSIKAQTWPASASKDKTIEVFISPAIDDPSTVMDYLLPELVHAAIGPEHKHNDDYKKACERLGLTGTAREPVLNDGTALHAETMRVIEKCGIYPHAKIDWNTRKRQSTRLIKASCPECGYITRTTRKWIEKAQPICPSCTTTRKKQMMDVDPY